MMLLMAEAGRSQAKRAQKKNEMLASSRRPSRFDISFILITISMSHLILLMMMVVVVVAMTIMMPFRSMHSFSCKCVCMRVYEICHVLSRSSSFACTRTCSFAPSPFSFSLSFSRPCSPVSMMIKQERKMRILISKTQSKISPKQLSF